MARTASPATLVLGFTRAHVHCLNVFRQRGMRVKRRGTCFPATAKMFAFAAERTTAAFAVLALLGRQRN